MNEQKIAIITGSGGGGSGRAIARRFAREVASVVVTDIDDAGGRETVRLIQAEGGRASFFRADLGAQQQVRELLAFAEETYGGLDILVNNASFPYHPEAPFEYWIETIEVDLLAAVLASRLAIDLMRKRAGGAIVSISSTSALGHGREHAQVPAFDVAKAGLIRFTTALGR